MRVSLIIVLLVFALNVGCEKTESVQTRQPSAVSLEPSASTDLAAAGESVAVMHVRGMACPQCAYNVDLQLLKVPGVNEVKVDMSNGIVVAKLSPENPPTRQQLTAAIRQTGFTLVKLDMN